MLRWGLLLAAGVALAQTSRDVDLGRGMFRIYCAPCHGIHAQGGRGPDLSRGVFNSGDTDEDLIRTISRGVPGTDMAAFGDDLPAENIRRIVAYVRSVDRHDTAAVPGDAARGEALFWGKGQCGQCHVVGGRGGRIGPELTRAGRQRSLAYLRESVLAPDADITAGYNTLRVVTRDGQEITGIEKGLDNFTAQLQDLQGRFRSFDRGEVASAERTGRSLMPGNYGKLLGNTEVNDLLAYLAGLRGSESPGSGARQPEPPHKPDPSGWLTYGNNDAGWRYSQLTGIDTGNVARLRPQWIFQSGVAGRGESTPLVRDGLIYLTGYSNTAWALDAHTGKPLWQYAKAAPKGLNLCCGHVNRGFAAIGDRLFKVNIEDTLVALDAASGKVLWETRIEDFKKGYTGTVAPLAVKNLVVVGTAGAEFGIRGFIDAYDAATGRRVWRFYTVPAPGEPGGDTWGKDSYQRGGGSTWITGTYDPDLNLIYWGTGNPGPDMNGDVRPGDNLYTCSMVALDADTGKLRWHFQFTPHDTHDWDAISDPVLVDLDVQGRKTKALIQANRNGFFYALDRTNGKMLVSRPYTKVTWSDGIGPDGRPRLIPGQDPSEEGTRACPALGGGHNWEATAYSPQTGLYYFTTTDGCQVYYKTTYEYQEGQWFMLSATDEVRGERRAGALLAVDPATGVPKWRYDTVEPPSGGVLATAGGLVFMGDKFGYLIAFDARTGKVLWKFQTGAPVAAPPISYALDGRQYIAVVSGGALFTFGL